MDTHQTFSRYSLAGLGATLIGNGIGRFAYIALMPALIQAGWFTESQASYLGAATLIGYIFGVPAISVLTRYFAAGFLIRAAMLVSGMSYIGCALETAPLAWFYLLRTLAGVAGAILIILAPPMMIRLHRAEIKAKVSGVIFSGIGVGALLSGTLVPVLIYFNLASAWLGMGAITLVTTVLTWNVWKENDKQQSYGVVAGSFRNLSKMQRMTFALILLAYSLDAVGYLPHTMFWVDYVVRELDMPFSAGGLLWASFGLGAMLGPILAGTMGDRFGVRRSLVVSYLLKGFGVALPLLSHHPLSLFLSALLVGIFTPGTVSLVSIYTLESVGYELHTKAWGAATMAFALAQGVIGYGMAHFAPILGSYLPLFALSACALVVSASLIAISKQPTSDYSEGRTAIQTKD